MFLGFLTLLTAICISAIAAYYSIVGLTAIFAAAVTPIIIMGAALEAGKVVTTLWLHYNWERSKIKIKVYLIFAVCMLMLITSMGIFGYLSKAHLDQAVPSGDIQAQIALIDEKILTQRNNIDTAKKAVAQLDGVVDQTLIRSTNTSGASRSAYLLRAQKKERAALQQDIDTAQATIAKLQEDRVPIASKMRKADAEVGPVKYIAAVIYGDKATATTLEDAVRIVIIIIVLVFDPLAIVLLLAATTSIDWARENRAIKREEKESADVEELIAHKVEQASELTRAKVEAEVEHDKLSEWTKFAEIAETSLAESKIANEELREEYKRRSDSFTHEISDLYDKLQISLHVAESAANKTTEMQQKYEELLTAKINLEHDLLTTAEAHATDLRKLTNEIMGISSELAESRINYDTLENVYAIRMAEMSEMITKLEQQVAELLARNDDVIATSPIVEESPLVAVEEEPVGIVATTSQPTHVDGPLLPVKASIADLPAGGNASFGTTFPTDPIKGDLFLRVDLMPNRLYKWSDSHWIELDKNTTDAYVYDEEYIKLLVSQIGSGEIDIDDLTESEQTQIGEYLKKTSSS